MADGQDVGGGSGGAQSAPLSPDWLVFVQLLQEAERTLKSVAENGLSALEKMEPVPGEMQGLHLWAQQVMEGVNYDAYRLHAILTTVPPQKSSEPPQQSPDQ